MTSAKDPGEKSVQRNFAPAVSNRPFFVPVPYKPPVEYVAASGPVATTRRVAIEQQRSRRMDTTRRPTGPPEQGGEQVDLDVELAVELLEVVYQANGRMAAELDRLTASRASVSEAAIERFLHLAEDLRPGAEARAHLARLDSETQIAGAAVWIARRRQLDPDTELLPTARGNGTLATSATQPVDGAAVGATALPAAARAVQRWRGVGSPR